MTVAEFAATYNKMYKRLYEYHMKLIAADDDGRLAALKHSIAIEDQLERELTQTIFTNVVTGEVSGLSPMEVHHMINTGGEALL